MTKKSSKNRSAEIFTKLEKISAASPPKNDWEDEPLDITILNRLPVQMVKDTSKTLRMKKFRIQLLHQWLVNTFEPCRVADIGGGKGLLSYLLIQSGWDATVIDPCDQVLPDKYKDISSGQRMLIPPNQKVPRITQPFDMVTAKDYDLLIGMHAHGCNAMVIDAAEKYGCGFVLFPCCVIDEPFYPRLGVYWLECLADYAVFRGQDIFPFRLNFKGQNIGLCHLGKRIHV